jgi:hypothetical protein
MCEPSPQSRGLLLRPVNGGLATGTGRRAHRHVARGRYGGWELTAETPRDRGDRGEPHRDVGGHRGGAVWPGDGETKAAANRARWEGNTGADGASRCEEWEGGAETAAARWSLTLPVSKSNRGMGVDGASS